ncbi:hypothetical protein COBT_002054 [Conglomerata obtusa]
MVQTIHEHTKAILEDKDRILNFKEALKQLEEKPDCSQAFWDSDGIPVIMLQEIIMAYNTIGTDKFTNEECTRICIILNILQLLLKNKNVKDFFIDSNFVLYLYPFLNLTQTIQKYEKLRIAVLGVIASFLDVNDDFTIRYIKNTEIVPLILKIMDMGSEVSKIIALHVFTKIIDNLEGIEYVCQTFDRFLAISVILNSMLYQCVISPSTKLLEYILDCYTKLAAKENVRMIFRNKKPDAFSNNEVLKQIEKNNLLQQKYTNFLESLLK